jgi:hypothetical protein
MFVYYSASCVAVAARRDEHRVDRDKSHAQRRHTRRGEVFEERTTEESATIAEEIAGRSGAAILVSEAALETAIALPAHASA